MSRHFHEENAPIFFANVPRPKELGEKEKPLPIFVKEAVKERRSKEKTTTSSKALFLRKAMHLWQ